MRYPCSYYGTEKCSCREADVKKYHRKISGPILDRIDLQVEMGRLSVEEKFAEAESGVSPRIRARVEAARERQVRRFEGTGIPFNAAISGGQVREMCGFSAARFEAYKEVIGGSSLSTRSADRLAKVSRTIADIFSADHVEPPHIAKAKQYVIGGVLREAF